MIILTSKGLYCPAGDFYIDPSAKVDHAVITHAHADHARKGSKQYTCVHSGVGLLKERVGKNINVQSYAYGEKFNIRGVEVSFHPAGHILGSSQVRMEFGGEVWVASGDYKRDPDPTCEPFETVKCDVFITEATFGTPLYVWPKQEDVGLQIYDWWMGNKKKNLNSVLFAYSLGKAQRILGVLERYATRPIFIYPTITPLNKCYQAHGIKLAKTICLGESKWSEPLNGELILAPQVFLKSPQSAILGGRFVTAFASGWMAQGDSEYSGYDQGFVMSDHADWNDLVRTIQESGAKRVYVQHRGHGALVKYLKSIGIKAYPDNELRAENPDQMVLF